MELKDKVVVITGGSGGIGRAMAKAFLAQMREQVNKFVEELTKGYRDMVDRGRDSRHDAPAEPAPPVDEPGQPA